MGRPQLSRRQLALSIALLYAILGWAWILFSDKVLFTLTSLSRDQVQRLGTFKGLIYVGLTALIIWWLVRRALTEVAEAESARFESESRYRQIFERTTSVCLLVDAETLRLVDVNPAAVLFYGWSREELIGKSIADIDTLPEPVLRERLRDARAEQLNFFVFRHRLRSGAVRDVEVHSSPIFLKGRPTLFSLVHDITDRVRAERQLVESEANYRRALEQASDAIIVSDRQGVILEVNARTEEILCCTREEIIGRRMEDFVAPEDRDRIPFRLRDLIEGRHGLSERRMQRKTGGFADVEISARDLGDGRYQAIVRDVSERRRLEEQLRQAQKMEAVGQLTGGIAHDLNNLLTVVLANSEMIAATLPAERDDLRSDLAELQMAARRGAQMIRKLLSFSRHAPLTYQVFDLGRLMEDLIGTMRRLLPAHIEVVCTREDAPLRVLADAGAVEQILLNLATNSRDAMPRGGTLRVETRRIDVARPPAGALPGSYACLSVSDNGVGMDDRVRARVFEPFFTTKPPGEGSGLGMAMIYGLTQQHGGFVELDSSVGKGTTVRVFFPMAREDQPMAELAPTPDGLRGGKERVLLVEDEDGLRRVAQRALEKVGYRVLTAADGLEALEVFRRNAGEIDLIITDVVMPKLGGIALYRAVRQDGHAVRFLFTSGYAADEIMQGDTGDGELSLLQKPWTLADLTHRVREVLDRAQSER
ncbi:MAG TPA: PAS domain S-box protein [Gemmatimonadales bacterium]|nr:PAS domain S-box protein [Gemmatimonadales bacterium]